MLPSTAASLFALLLFVAPGFLYQTRRERVVPRPEETPFREVSSVALASVACSGAALFVLALVRQIHAPLMPQPKPWLAHSHAYVANHWALVGRFLFLEVGIACLIAFIASSLARPDAVTGNISSVSAWWAAFRTTEPGKTKYATVRLKNGAEYLGVVHAYNPRDCPPAERELVLTHDSDGESLYYRAPGEVAYLLLDDHERVILSGETIESLTVKHLERAPTESTPHRWWRKLFPWVWATRAAR